MKEEGCLFKSCFTCVLALIIIYPEDSAKFHITPLARSHLVSDLCPVPWMSIVEAPATNPHTTVCKHFGSPWCLSESHSSLLVSFSSSCSLWRDFAGLNREFFSPWLSKWLPILFPLCLEDLSDPRGEGRCKPAQGVLCASLACGFACDDGFSNCQWSPTCPECRVGAWKCSWAPLLSSREYGNTWSWGEKRYCWSRAPPQVWVACWSLILPLYSRLNPAWTLCVTHRWQSDELDKMCQQAGGPKTVWGAVTDISSLLLSHSIMFLSGGLLLPVLKHWALLCINYPPRPLSSQLLLFYWSSCGNEIFP